jgi:SAM-dependent methyltransferase
MTLEVLQKRTSIDEARKILCRRGLSFTSSWWRRFWNKLGISNDIEIGDKLKSWDVLRTVSFIEKNIPKTEPILDIGAFASEILCILYHLKYSNLTGIDLCQDIKKMSYREYIHYEVANFMHTPFADGTFGVITAISVIEHGFKSKLLLAEVSRLLRPGGYFIASFDYWPEKVNTSGISFFGMDWRIFSKQEVCEFLEDATAHHLCPSGTIDMDAQERPISCAKRDYTFAWLALRKQGSADPLETIASTLSTAPR